MRTLFLAPGEAMIEKEIPNTLEGIQSAVEGLFEVVRIGREIVCVCNDEGKIRGMQPNFRLPIDGFFDLICGPAFFCLEVHGPDGGEFADLTDEQVEYLKGWYE